MLDIFILISSENFMLSYVEHEKSFITSRPGPDFGFNFKIFNFSYVFMLCKPIAGSKIGNFRPDNS